MSRLIFLAALAAVAATAACGERADPGPTAPPDAASPDAASRGGVAEVHVTDIQRAGRAAEERLARRMAMALADPGFRAYVKGALDHSTVREHKLHFRRLLEGQGARGMQALARAGREAPSVVQSDVGARVGTRVVHARARASRGVAGGRPTCWSPPPGPITKRRWPSMCGAGVAYSAPTPHPARLSSRSCPSRPTSATTR